MTSLDFDKIEEELVDYSEMMNDELGDFIGSALTFRRQCNYAFTEDLKSVIEKELTAQWQNIKDNAKIVEYDIPVSHIEHRKKLVWKDEM